MFPALIAAEVIRELPPTAVEYIYSCLASPSSCGMEFDITVFAPYVVVNSVSSDVQEGAACETLVLLTVHQQCIRVVQSLGTFNINFLA